MAGALITLRKSIFMRVVEERVVAITPGPFLKEKVVFVIQDRLDKTRPMFRKTSHYYYQS